jgi:outer membrane receptor protein involved in Fe transport
VTHRPAQAPRVTITGGGTWQPIEPLSLDARLRWESSRFDDDQNTLPLGSALVLDLRGTYRLTESLAGYLAIDNVTDAKVATAATRDPLLGEVLSYAQPRMVWLGLTYFP